MTMTKKVTVLQNQFQLLLISCFTCATLVNDINKVIEQMTPANVFINTAQWAQVHLNTICSTLSANVV